MDKFFIASMYLFFSVLVAKNDIVKISDFGTSRTWNEKSTKMSFAGTVAWMAPEVIRNEPCSEKVDIWYICLFTLSNWTGVDKNVCIFNMLCK